MPSGEVRNAGYLAVDRGPELALKALAARLPGRWLESRAGEVDRWLDDLGRSELRLLVCGTSDTDAGRSVESAARRAARKRGIPVVVIEDFPGNYFAVAGGEPRVVFVDSEFSARLARSKDRSPSIEISPSVRYDALRRKIAQIRHRAHETEDAVLWIGQPETQDSLRTLRRLLPALEARGTSVWFRAHPRDPGYATGAYEGLRFEDLTARSLDECLARRPRLVATQFSSVAIEAGFWGIPSLNVLFADVGGRRLAAKKGYSVPPWCEDGAAFLIVDPKDIDSVLDRALRSRAARHAVMQSFDRYFQVSTEGAPALIKLLYNQGLL